MRGAQDRRHDRDRGGHGSGQGYDSDVRLRGHFEGTQRGRGAQIPSGGWGASGAQQKEIDPLSHGFPHDDHPSRRYNGNFASLLATDSLQ